MLGPTIKILLLVLLTTVFGSACTTLPRDPVPLDMIMKAQMEGMPNVRAWGGRVSPVFQKDMIESIKQEQRSDIKIKRDKRGIPIYNALALSGGGSHGAFGAGFLYGWSQSGQRPEFKLVSGISTGALIAPFAFVGEEYDEKLKKVYTTTSTSMIAKIINLLTIFRSEALAKTDPLKKLLKESVDAEMIKDVAREHDKGRRLYLGTTNMDAQRLVVWNMGLIAKSDHPDKEQIFRDVMMASTVIPAAFPPVYFKVEADGKIFDEMHSDGGTISQVIFYGGTLD